MKAASVIIMTHLEGGEPKLPHLDELKRSNPDLEVHVCVGRENGRSKRHHWKNSDRELRHFWQENGHRVRGAIVLVIEWDTLIEVEIPELPDGLDLAGAMVFREDFLKRKGNSYRLMSDPRWSPSAWLWFQEAPRLGLGSFPCVGLVSFGFMLVDRICLDWISLDRWDVAFEKSLQNELRFPSIAAFMGARVGEIPLPGVNHCETEPGEESGIWHSVKAPRNDLEEILRKS